MTASVVPGTATETPGVGPDELLDYWPLLGRLGWFLVGFLAVAVVGWLFVVPVVDRVVSRRNRNNPTIRAAIPRYVKVVVVLLATLVGVTSAGFGRILAGSALVVAAATLVVGVAGQEVVGSLLSGLVLVFDPEFNVGDYVEWEDGQGTIQAISLRFTRLRTLDGGLCTVPNTWLTGQSITRPYAGTRFRIVQQIGLDYDDDLTDAMATLHETATALESVEAAPSPRVYVSEFGSDVVVLEVHYWIGAPTPPDVLETQTAYAEAAKERMDAAGFTLAPANSQSIEGHISVDGTASDSLS